MNDARREWAGIIAAQIVNLHLHSDKPPAVVYSDLVRIILAGMAAVQDDIKERRLEPSDN